MNKKAGFALRGRNPDVLTCIANLSNDEVFTPPEIANCMLNTLTAAWAEGHDGANIWEDKTIKFLDPCTKSGVFLREITTRLVKGLADEIPDLQQRVDHIFTKQVFGIGITRLTGLLARRSVYCSKHANGTHSIASCLNDESGNILFEQTEHSWKDGKCKHCRASQNAFDRGAGSETHAYAFIHADNIKARIAEFFGEEMQFDVIIGNPPYQLDDGGFGASAIPIYNRFVDQAKALEPRYLTMVIPARWLFGGRGLDEFRSQMLNDNRIRKLVDYHDSRLVFQNVDIAGGICYFLWDQDNPGDCHTVEFNHEQIPKENTRPLLEKGADIFIRNHCALSILRKVRQVETDSDDLLLPEQKRFDRQVSSQKPFGLRTYFRGSKTKLSEDDLIVVQSGGRAWTSRSKISIGFDLIDKWKVFTSATSAEHAGQLDKNGQRRVISLLGVIPPGSVVTETYVLLGAYNTEIEAQNCYSYVRTKFFRFLVSLRSFTQHLARLTYSFVPIQDFSKAWTDEELYLKYSLTDEEIANIERLIRPMGDTDE